MLFKYYTQTQTNLCWLIRNFKIIAFSPVIANERNEWVREQRDQASVANRPKGNRG